jgi:drug/metabolite transporter (DMT)-like permease
VGLGFFFSHRLAELRDTSRGLGLGVILLLLSALLWASYGLAQKQLLRRMPSQQILLVLYAGAVLLLLPASAPGNVVRMTGLQLAMLAFSCANTLVAYGAFAEALAHWEASRIGAVLSLAPVFTLIGMQVTRIVAPAILPAEPLNALSVIGALMVVAGSAICALGAKRVSPG